MFNPLTPSEMITAIGLAAREAARASDGPLSEFERTQLKVAYSGTRHLAVEIASFPGERARFRAAVQELVPSKTIPQDEPGLAAFVADLLQACRERELHNTRAAIQRLLRELCDREVWLLARGLEGGR